MSLIGIFCRLLSERLPRTRGDEPDWLDSLIGTDTSAPHSRG